jgi:hypothetical protein
MNIEVIDDLVSKRNEARRCGDFPAADRIREELKEMGVTVSDTPEGSIWEFTETIRARQKERRLERMADGFITTMKARGEGFARRG